MKSDKTSKSAEDKTGLLERILHTSLGLDTGSIIRRIKKTNTSRLLAEMESAQDLLPRDLSRHFAHEVLGSEDEGILRLSILGRIRLLKRYFSRDEQREESFLDLGDPDGIFLASLGKDGISANLSPDACRNCRNNAIEAIRCDLNHLPLRENAVDHLFLFQTLEHLANPLSTLLSLYPVCRKSLTLSVPCVERTVIHRANYDPGRRSYEHHIFEFSDDDLRRLLTHTPFRIASFDHTIQFDERKSPLLHRLLIHLYWMAMRNPMRDPEYHTVASDLFDGSFTRLTVVHLRK